MAEYIIEFPVIKEKSNATFKEEIVRCRDCIHGDPNGCGEVICEMLDGKDHFRPENWYCADGERR